MARTKEFDPDKALKIAVNVFWRLGYEHTSLETLMREMGISKQSLYDTFGDKRSIYFRAMSRYRDDTNGSLRKLFAREKSVRKGFAKIFQAMIGENKAQQQSALDLTVFRRKSLERKSQRSQNLVSR